MYSLSAVCVCVCVYEMTPLGALDTLKPLVLCAASMIQAGCYTGGVDASC